MQWDNRWFLKVHKWDCISYFLGVNDYQMIKDISITNRDMHAVKKAHPNIITCLFLSTIQQIKLISSQIQPWFKKKNIHHSSTAANVWFKRQEYQPHLTSYRLFTTSDAMCGHCSGTAGNLCSTVYCTPTALIIIQDALKKGTRTSILYSLQYKQLSMNKYSKPYRRCLCRSWHTAAAQSQGWNYTRASCS